MAADSKGRTLNEQPQDSASWTDAKARGDEGELVVAEWFKGRGCDVTKTLGNDSYDLLVMMKMEVKNDLRAVKTGSVAVEVRHRDRPSGIMTTSADRYVFVVGETAYLVRTKQLRSLVESGNFREVPAGDGGLAQVKLVPLNMLSNLAWVQVLDLAEARK